MDTLASIRAVLAVAAEHSFTRGGQRLHLSTRRVSTLVQQLEQRTGMRLFNRTTRSVALTEAGRQMLPRLQRLVADFDEIESDLLAQRQRLAGTLRVTAPTGFGSLKLAPALQPFLAQHPEISIDLDLSDRRADLIDDGFDLAIRLGALPDSSLMARKLADLRIVLCASPAYLRQRGEPRHPEELPQFDCVPNRGLRDGHHWVFRSGDKRLSVRVDGRVRANTPQATAQLAATGLGIAQVPYYTAETLINEGRLHLLLPAFEPQGSGVFAVYPPDRHLPARVRALIDHLADHWRAPSPPAAPRPSTSDRSPGQPGTASSRAVRRR